MTARPPTVAPAPTYEGGTGLWEAVVGLEVHAQVVSKSKLFSSAPASFGASPNENVSLVDAAMPGMLPVLNRHCVKQAVRTGLGLGARINQRSIFDRKNYFYPDLPQGYQISQYSDPVSTGGEVRVRLKDGSLRRVRIVRLHLEQDAGRSIHDREPGLTLIDLNRSGVPLMEIVTEPDLRSAEEAAAFVRELRSILRYLGTCSGNMEEGSLRTDVNVSVRRPGAKLGTRCEIKNVNSIRFVQQAVRYEIRRQIALIESGETVDQETRLFDPVDVSTRAMRTKEDAHDYRYFPDPDLLPLELEEDWIEGIRSSLPELPEAKRTRLVQECGLPEGDAATLAADPEAAAYFDALAGGRDPILCANWVLNELFGYLRREEVSIGGAPVAAPALGAILDLLESGRISSKGAKDVFAEAWRNGGDPAEIVQRLGLAQVKDTGEIEAAVDRVIAANPDEAQRARKKPNLAGWFVGQVMRETRGRADPKQASALVRKKLGLD